MSAELKVDFCDHKAAEYAVKHWHYSKALPMPPLITIGAWEGGKFIGCVLFGRGATPHLGDPYGLKIVEVCELVRVALASHKTPVSRIISLAIGLLRKTSPDLRLIISFADPNYNHIGAIYQAGNWIYTGKTDDHYMYKYGSKLLHPRQVSKSGVKPQFGKMTRVPRMDDCQKVEWMGKYRYLYPLDRAMRKQIQPLAKPYPKRDLCGLGEIDNAAHSNAQTGGASPTSPLTNTPTLVSG